MAFRILPDVRSQKINEGQFMKGAFSIFKEYGKAYTYEETLSPEQKKEKEDAVIVSCIFEKISFVEGSNRVAICGSLKILQECEILSNKKQALLPTWETALYLEETSVEETTQKSLEVLKTLIERMLHEYKAEPNSSPVFYIGHLPR